MLATNCHHSYSSFMKRNEQDMALRVLRDADWLKQYPITLAERLLAEGTLMRLNVGEWAQAEGDTRNGLFVVIDGLLHSYCAAPGDRLVMIGFAEPGSVLGHATRYSGGPRLVTAICVEPTILLEISEAALDRVAVNSPEIWRAIAGFAYANMRSALRMAAGRLVYPSPARTHCCTLARNRQAWSGFWTSRHYYQPRNAWRNDGPHAQNSEFSFICARAGRSNPDQLWSDRAM